MKTISFLYIDDGPEPALAKYLDKGYKNDKYREDDSFNPCNINYHDSLKTVFEKLDIQIDEFVRYT